MAKDNLDSDKLAALLKRQDTGDALKYKWGNVISEAGDMVNVRISGFQSLVSCHNWTGARVGDVVGVICKGTLWFAVATNAGSGRAAGFIQAYGGAAEIIPAGWLACDGSILYTADYPQLYLVIGRNFTDSGVSSDRFALPDLGGRVAQGVNKDSAIGSVGGTSTHSHGNNAEQNGTLAAMVGSSLGEANAIQFRNSDTYVTSAGNGTYRVYGTTAAGTGFSHHTRVVGNTAEASSKMPYTTVNYVISTGSGFDVAGNIITAGIANGAVTMEKLSPELRPRVESFVYRNFKQDTGRRTDDDYIIWGQKFLGTVTTAGGQVNEQTLISGLPQAGRLINAFGSFTWSGTVLGVNASLIGGANTSGNYSAWVIRRATGTIAIETVANNARTNSPYEVFVDWTDGTR